MSGRSYDAFAGPATPETEQAAEDRRRADDRIRELIRDELVIAGVVHDRERFNAIRARRLATKPGGR